MERERERVSRPESDLKIERPQGKTYTEEQLKGFANEMLRVLGGINWDQAGISLDGISDEHPLKPVLDALAIIKLDVDRLLQEKEKSQKSLQDSEEKYRTLLESIEAAYFEVDLRGNFTFFNHSLSKILGYSKDELMGMNNRDYMPPRTSEEMFDLFHQIYKTGNPVRKYDYEVIKKDGTHGFHELVASLIRDQNGQPIGFRGIAHDITDRKRAEDELRESEALFHSLIDYMHDAMIILDWEGTILFSNQAATKMIEAERPGAYVGHNMVEFIHPDSLRKVTEDL
jgi:PAS domain S-box-containing protein